METDITYNGWTNRDTWLVPLWLDTEYNNYKKLCNYLLGKGIATEKRIENISDADLMFYLRDSYTYKDEINWENVNITEIREFLLDSKKGLQDEDNN